MAVLPDAQRKEVWAEFMRAISDAHEPVGIKKTDLRATLDAMDQWISDNMASFNAALPQPGRTSLTTQQKARGMMYVIQKRFLTGV